MDQLYVRHPEAMVGVAEDFDKLRLAIDTAAINLAEKGQRLYIVVDGLDHVWRDTQRVDQLNHLFNELLPLPPNVSLLVGTQRVADNQLPGRLLTLAKDADWIEIPRMDEVSVHRWVVQQDTARPLILRMPDRRPEQIDEIAKALFNVSQGHPLHLIYAFEGLIRSGRPTSAEEVELLPPCPDGDIRTYYQGLWVRLRADAKNALHMLAGSDFFWPSLGIRQVLGGYSEVDFLLEPRNVGMVPFHSSIFAFVRERPDHEESYIALLPKVILWLANDAPEYWRWGWLWLARARGGDFTELLAGVTRDWVVESLAKGWPDQQIENILAAAERRTFDEGDLPRTITIRSLKYRVSNVREFQSRDFAAYRATALAVSDNRQQTLNLLDDIHDLSDSEVTELARLGPDSVAAQVLPACLNELARRVNAWITLRHRPEQEFTKLSDQLLAVSALMDEATVRRTLNFARGFRNPEPHVSRLIQLLGEAQNTEGLQLVRKTLSAAKWLEQRRSIDDAIIRAAGFAGADPKELIPPARKPLSAFAASWFLWRNRNADITAHIPPVPSDLIRERYSLGNNADVTDFFCDAFWIAIYFGLKADGDYSLIYPGLVTTDQGWLPNGLVMLEEVAQGICNGKIAPSFSVVYSETEGLRPVAFGPSPEREYSQYRAFLEALRRISLDLHLLSLPGSVDTKISAPEFAIARASPHWSDEMWVSRNISMRARLLESDAAAALLTAELQSLSTKATEFSERSERWAQLADLALLYEDGRQGEFLDHAAECLVGYGWRKDLGALDVLDALVETSAIDPKVTRERLSALVPIIEVITDFTDGDETGHVRSELSEVVGKIAPERLPSVYQHHLSIDEWKYADECLTELAKTLDLRTPEGAALARTFLDSRILYALEQRAAADDVARSLLERQNAFLGNTPTPKSDSAAVEEELSDQEKAAQKVEPSSFGPDNFSEVVLAAGAVHYRHREEFLRKWLRHWKDQGKATRALRAILTYFDTTELTHGAEEILDESFLVSLAVEGKDAAYPWLVRAHIHRHGWQTHWTSEEEIMTRLKLAAEHYPDRWLQYVRDTSLPAPYYQRRRFTFVLGYQYLVRFLMLVGQENIANQITDEFVKGLIEEVREQPIPEAPWFR